jgi:hypothetical protein
MKELLLVAVIVAAGYAAYWYLQSPQTDPAHAVQKMTLPLAENERPSAMVSNRHEVRPNPREMVRSIYNADLKSCAIGFRRVRGPP